MVNLFAEEHRLKAKSALERAEANLEAQDFIRASGWVQVAEQWLRLAEIEEAARQ